MRLSELLTFLPEPAEHRGPDPEITSIVYDSRRASSGSLFVARWHPGYAADGHEFAAQAIEAGAAGVVVQRPVAVPDGVAVVHVVSTPRALGWLSAGFYGMPSCRLGIVGVTGTDGKTTTCALTTAVLEAGGFTTGMASTVASKTSGPLLPNPAHTSTPEAVEIQALLADTADGGGTRAVLEATSHALDQERLTACELDVAVVTRVTHEHLEYHGTWDAYIAAKAKLLGLLEPNAPYPKREQLPKAAVLNADDERSLAYMTERSPAPVLTFGVEQPAAVRASQVRTDGWDTRAHVVTPWGTGELRLQLPGAFNVYNALAALAAGCTLGAPLDVALAALSKQTGVRGRMERIEVGQPFKVVVDFAHTPDSLTQVLRFLRPLTQGRLLVMFGSAGERDKVKRPWMGRIAAQHADFFVITDEDPRLEESEQILADIAAGANEAGATEPDRYLRIPNRRRAIAAALARAKPTDTVLLAGKGHETSILGNLDGKLHSFPWDERQVALEELSSLGFANPPSP